MATEPGEPNFGEGEGLYVSMPDSALDNEGKRKRIAELRELLDREKDEKLAEDITRRIEEMEKDFK